MIAISDTNYFSPNQIPVALAFLLYILYRELFVKLLGRNSKQGPNGKSGDQSASYWKLEFFSIVERGVLPILVELKEQIVLLHEIKDILMRDGGKRG